MFIGEVMAFLITNIGPKGIHSVKCSVDHYKWLKNNRPILLNYSHLIPLSWCRHIRDKKTNRSLPLHARGIVDSCLQNEVTSTLVDKIKDNGRRTKKKWTCFCVWNNYNSFWRKCNKLLILQNTWKRKHKWTRLMKF